MYGHLLAARELVTLTLSCRRATFKLQCRCRSATGWAGTRGGGDARAKSVVINPVYQYNARMVRDNKIWFASSGARVPCARVQRLIHSSSILVSLPKAPSICQRSIQSPITTTAPDYRSSIGNPPHSLRVCDRGKRGQRSGMVKCTNEGKPTWNCETMSATSASSSSTIASVSVDHGGVSITRAAQSKQRKTYSRRSQGHWQRNRSIQSSFGSRERLTGTSSAAAGTRGRS